jgi:glycosyltransferase involved in cell wall biosynthesis
MPILIYCIKLPNYRAINMSISVCIATYNGEEHILAQLTSILSELDPEDEVIIVDDCSKDATVAVIESLADPRIAVHRNERNRREVYSFNRAIGLAKNEFIFLSDQDDIWIPGRVALMLRELSSGAMLVTSNFENVNNDLKTIDIPYEGVAASNSHKHLQNIVDIFIGKTNYFGCAMAFRRELCSLALPIPAFVESHDLWLAMAGNISGNNVHLDANTLRKRKHGKNVTNIVSNRALYKKLRSRAFFAASMLVLAGRRLSSQQAVTRARG